jgi:hypothetical protein
VILGHLGEMLPSNIWRISHWASPNGRHPQGVPIERSFIDYFRQNFYVTTSGNFRTIAMRNAIEELGTARVLFFEEMEEAASWFDAAEIGENDREAIGRDNAKRLFRPPPSPRAPQIPPANPPPRTEDREPRTAAAPRTAEGGTTGTGDRDRAATDRAATRPQRRRQTEPPVTPPPPDAQGRRPRIRPGLARPEPPGA